MTSLATDNVVLVAVGQLDRRAYVALRRGLELAGGVVRAVHVAGPDEDTHEYAVEWTRTGLDMSVPLEIVETNERCAAQIRAAVVEALQQHRGLVTLVVGRLKLRRSWHRVLHDQSDEQIVAAVADLERVRVDVVDVPV
jgi:hypothetical protein